MELGRRLPVLSILLSVLGTLGGGCVTPPSGIKKVEMTEQEDIPVPKSFELRYSFSPDMKIDRPEARFRSWTGEYGGAAQVGVVVPWYITEMKRHQWQYRGFEDKGPDNKLLYFEKGDEVSKVDFSRRLEPKEGGFITIVRAEVHPKGPEDYTVDEHLRARDSGAGIRPASFASNVDDAAPAPAAAHEAESSISPAAGKPAKAGSTQPARKTKSGSLQPEKPAARNSTLKPDSESEQAGDEESATPPDIRELEHSAR